MLQLYKRDIGAALILSFTHLFMQPRMLMTVDENLKPISVPVRVGQAVDVVGQAGRPKTITGFQTHSTPVLLAAGDRAELATEKYKFDNPKSSALYSVKITLGFINMILEILCRYIPLSPVLEGFVILKENPEYRDDH